MKNKKITEFEKQAKQNAWNAADTRIRENENTYIKYIFTFSSAFLGFSIALVTSVSVKSNAGINKDFLLFCWLLIVLTIFLGLLLLLVSKKANEKYVDNLQREFNGENKECNYYDILCSILEWTLFFLLFVAVLCNILFFLNIFDNIVVK